MTEALMAAARCDCSGYLEWTTEQTARGLRWVFVCQGCGSRWGHRDGVFGPLDRRPTDRGGLSLQECALLAYFRCLTDAQRLEAMARVRALLPVET